MPGAAYRYPIVAREGWRHIGVAILLALLSHQYLTVWPALLFWLLAVVLLFLFRDPYRRVPASPLGVVSPVDGEVVDVTEIDDPWLQRKAVCVRMNMAPFGVYSIRSPVEGKVFKQWFPRRREREDPLPKAYVQWVRTDEGDDVALAIVPHMVRRRPFCYVETGQRVGQGQRCGYFAFGTRVQLLLPVGVRVKVAPGDRVRSGTDVLAVLVHE